MSRYLCDVPSDHVFISYITEDSEQVDELQGALEAAGFIVWRDKQRLWPGDDWQQEIRNAIRGGSFVFLACFSSNLAEREKSYQFEELTLAAEEFRTRPPGASWLMTARLDECEIPDFDLGAGRTLGRSIHRADLFGAQKSAQLTRLIVAIQRATGSSPASASTSAARDDRGRPISSHGPLGENPAHDARATSTLPSVPTISRSMWDAANNRDRHDPVLAAKVGSYRKAIEYIEMSAGQDVADVEVHTSNRLLSNSEFAPYLHEVPTDEEWEDQAFFDAMAPVVDAAAVVLSVIAGWTDPPIGGAMRLDHHRRDRLITQSFDPPPSGSRHPWGSSNGLVHVRRWVEYRNVDNGYLDLWVTANEDPYQIMGSYLRNDDDVLGVLAGVEADVRDAMSGLARSLLGSSAVHLAGRTPAWESDSMPVTGGDAYRFRYVITGR